MKKFLKAFALAVVCVMAFSMTACTTYTKNGSVIQDVKFDVSYTVDGEVNDINATLSLYKTFAPKTCDRIIELVNNGFYNNSALVLSKQQDYVVVGGFDFDEDYVQKTYTGESLKGEFTSAGRESKLSVTIGSLVMLRDFDTNVGGAKYDTAKASFAIVLGNTTTFDKEKFCVFGKIDSQSVTLLQEALIDNAMYDEAYMRVKYVGDREDGVLTSNNAFEYYYDGSNYYNLVDGEYEEMIRASEEDPDYEKYEKLTNSDNVQDIFVLPKTVFKIKTELCRGENKK